jgi:spoIIIJ-associated protein
MSEHDDWVPQEGNDEQAGAEETSASANGAEGRERTGQSRRAKETFEPPDERSALALEFVSDVVQDMGMDCEVHLRRPGRDNPEEVIIEITGKDSGRIIGKKGQVLQALQFLTHRVVNRPGEERRHILVDAEGYRSRRDDNLATMARRLGKQAVELGKIITFEPMNPRDRRVVHMALAKFEGVITKSDGEGDDRRVQIIPVRR